MNDYHKGAGIKLNGVKVPNLVPGERLNMHTSGNVDNGFTDLESSILRWMAAGLNVPYEPFAKDYRNSAYSSSCASMLEGWRYFMGRRKIIAGRFASQLFALVLEEALQRRERTLPRSATRGFYEAKGAWCNSDWIGSGRLAIDGLKEVKEAILRIESGLSTYEKELALMGEDYQEVFAQQVREMAERREAGLPMASWVQAEVLA
ncbi:MAG: phage portal protein, partial [Motiliproteus sp.]